MDYPPARLLNPRKLPGLLAACLVVALLGVAPSAPRLELYVARATFDPLDAIDVTVRVFNDRKTPVVMRFGQTAEYGLAIQPDAGDRWMPRVDAARWSSAATTGGRPHVRTFGPGYTTLVTYEWNGVFADGSAPAPGMYVLRGTVLSTGTRPDAALLIRIDAPLPISALAKTGVQVVTVAGTLDANGMTLHDASGEVKLARRIANVAPETIVDVRGSLATQPDGTRALAVERWAPSAAPVTVPASASPGAIRGRELAAYVRAQNVARKALAKAYPDLSADFTVADSDGAGWSVALGRVPDFAFFIDAYATIDPSGKVTTARNPPYAHDDLGGSVVEAHDIDAVRKKFGTPRDDYAAFAAGDGYDVYLFDPAHPESVRAYHCAYGGQTGSDDHPASIDPIALAPEMAAAFLAALHG